MNEQMLKEQAKKIRKDIVTMIGQAKSGHPGGSLSAAEIVTYLYFEEMNVNPADPKWEDRDRFVLSKGHAAPVLYAALAHKGYFPIEELATLRKIGSHLQGHPDMNKVPGVDMSTGSLGTGISAAVGMALAGKLDKKEHYVFTLLGDGELQEGQVWEAAMAAGHYKLDNLIAFVDNNKLQLDGSLEEIMSSYPIGDKFRAFGWNVLEVNGHDVEQISDAVEFAFSMKGKPTVIVADTVKGKGVTLFENNVNFHGSQPKAEEWSDCYAQLDAKIAELEG